MNDVFNKSYYCYGNLLQIMKLMIPMCVPTFGQVFDTMIVTITLKEWL